MKWMCSIKPQSTYSLPKGKEERRKEQRKEGMVERTNEQGTEGMAHLVKCLSYKLEDPKSVPQYPHKMSGMAMHIPKPMLRGGTGALVFADSFIQPTGEFQLSMRRYLQKKSNQERPEANL